MLSIALETRDKSGEHNKNHALMELTYCWAHENYLKYIICNTRNKYIYIYMYIYIGMYNVLHIYVCVCVKVKVKSLSSVRLFATPWTVAYEAMCVYNV